MELIQFLSLYGYEIRRTFVVIQGREPRRTAVVVWTWDYSWRAWSVHSGADLAVCLLPRVWSPWKVYSGRKCGKRGLGKKRASPYCSERSWKMLWLELRTKLLGEMASGKWVLLLYLSSFLPPALICSMFIRGKNVLVSPRNRTENEIFSSWLSIWMNDPCEMPIGSFLLACFCLAYFFF